jgi:hypothetical protein
MKSMNIIGVFLIAVLIISPAMADDITNIFFLHHSTGGNLISQGNVRSLIATYNTQHGTSYEFWDHGYNGDGVHDQSNTYYSNYNIPDDNTNPDGFNVLFAQPVHTPPDNAFSRIMNAHQMGARTITHQVFIFKSCFPASNITSEQMLADYKTWYLAMRDVMDEHPDKIFIPLTPPPLTRTSTTVANAGRAQRFADWLTSPEYLSGHPNIFVFDFRDCLMERDSTSIYYNCLRQAYGGAGDDSHPNTLANQTVGPIFVAFIINSITSFQAGQSIDQENGDAVIPQRLTIKGNYPNPFNNSTNIEFYLPKADNIKIELFNVLGQKSGDIFTGQKSAGWNSVNLVADNLNSGTYFYRIQTGNDTRTGRFSYLK